jgi:hypothetical protein
MASISGLFSAKDPSNCIIFSNLGAVIFYCLHTQTCGSVIAPGQGGLLLLTTCNLLTQALGSSVIDYLFYQVFLYQPMFDMFPCDVHQQSSHISDFMMEQEATSFCSTTVHLMTGK